MKTFSFIFFAMLSVVAACGEYAITRPASNSLFLTLFSAKGYPWVWLATVPLNLFAIYLYNRFLSKIGPLRMLCTIALTTITVNGATALFPAHLIFFQYAWKDIYILLMLKQIWSMIHATIPTSKSKYLYGCIYGMGTIGAIGGSLIPTFFASFFGSEKILFFTLPAYLLLMFSYKMAFQRSGVIEEDFTPNPKPKEALSLIRHSPVLTAVLLLVIFMQVSVGLIEYQFNTHLELTIIGKDLRTAYCGKISSIVNTISLAFQFLGSFFMVRALGLRKSHFLIPILLGSSAILSMTLPTFAILSCSYVFLKAVDFSLFGVIREMLYAPLQLEAKFRAKAIIDVFAYRSSKAIISLGLAGLQAVVAVPVILQISRFASIAIFCGWLITVTFLFRRRDFIAV